jgi:CheY-like chemotaxis protein
VLVVDSDAALRRVVRLVLEEAGWRTLTAPDTESAEELVRAERPKLVLAEVRLTGDETGQELARRFAKDGGWRPRVALMSAYPRPRRGYEDYFLSKPLEFDRLIKILESIEGEPGW